MKRFAFFLSIALIALPIASLPTGHAKAQSEPPLPPLQPPAPNWCTQVQAPNGKLVRWCGRLDQWQHYATVSCLRADAIGRPPPLSQDNNSPYWAAASICTSARVALDKVTQTANAAEAAYKQALQARQRLHDMGASTAQTSALSAIPLCASSGPSASMPLCRLGGMTGEHLASQAYSLNCGAYDCEAMAQEYRRTGRVPAPRERS